MPNGRPNSCRALAQSERLERCGGQEGGLSPAAAMILAACLWVALAELPDTREDAREARLVRNNFQNCFCK